MNPRQERQITSISKSSTDTAKIQCCILEYKHTPPSGQKDDFVVKVIYMHATRNQINPTLRCRKIIYECKGAPPFFFTYEDGIMEQELIKSGTCGDIMFCLYHKNDLNQNVWIGQWVIPLNFHGKFSGMSTFAGRDGTTTLDDSFIKVEIDILIPFRIRSFLAAQNSSHEAAPSDVGVNLYKKSAGVYHEVSKPNKDICASVAERHRKSFQRRFEKQRSLLLEENARMNLRLYNISTRRRNLA